MKRKLQRVGREWLLPLSAEQLEVLGIDSNGTEAGVLVRVEQGDVPRLIIRRAPTFDEAMHDTLEIHGEAIARLAAIPDDAEKAREIGADSEG